MVKNLVVADNGGIIKRFSSQYHHESRCLNLLNRDPSLVWFSDALQQLPQEVVFEFKELSAIKKVGMYLHGENNMNPKHIEIYLAEHLEQWTKVVDTELEHRAGDHLFLLAEDIDKMPRAKFARFVITENFGGSGIHISKAYVFGTAISELSPSTTK